MAPKQQKKKGQAVKEGRKTHPTHVQGGPATQAGPRSQGQGLHPGIQLKQQQQHQPPPTGFVAPPVAPLEASQMLENSFDSLTPHFGPPLMHLPHHAANSSSTAPPHPLSAQPAAGPVSPETHPFLNPVPPSPGMAPQICSNDDLDRGHVIPLSQP